MQTLLGLEPADLQALLPGQPAFRARQLYEAIYHGRVTSLEAVSTLPKAVRDRLASECSLGHLTQATRYQSSDGTRRYLLSLQDGKSVEAVFMPEENRDTLCISTQVGCPVDCKFCLTALMGLERNLTAGEIVGQVLHLAQDNNLWSDQKRINIVMMGQGEPLLNLANVLKATRLLCDAKGLGIAPRRITVSTSGIIPKMAELAQAEVRPRLAISLNGSNQDQRAALMPITRKHNLAALMEACCAYPLRPWEKLTFEYVLLKDVNDSAEDARRVVRLLANLNCKVNLIALNPGPGIPFETPDPERVTVFQEILKRSFPCFVRRPRGLDIFAACGQLKRMETAGPALVQL
ncbi:23S rRNA (adenine(2503)-C(2))-methyltransferase RlmN [uncultured Paludibaculum sp.]|uniref:23S rRNA (adenine(2503)-C(2))-methyltransferase RlmN n=1 Tax=uncultured Paludibaculum sp. TaxID=1765020 RepID=UPI002AAB67BD|nr:23S rRNA (adenine(2503)-C(2))-methyltransferase RlmN [uncultured Paludibaculum sp.]